MADIKDVLREFGSLAERWDDLTDEEKSGMLDQIISLANDEEKPKEPVTLTEEEEMALARLSTVSVLITSFVRDSVPIPPKIFDFYNDQVKILYGFSESVFDFAEEMFDRNIGKLEQTAVETVRSNLRKFNGEVE